MNFYVPGGINHPPPPPPLNLIHKKRNKSNFDRLSSKIQLRNIKSRIDLRKEWIFFSLKLLNCVFITLAYYGFTYGKLPQIINEFKNGAPIHKLIHFQSKLFIIEFIFWIMPFFIYILWFKSNLIKFNFSKILFLCSIFSFLISLTDLGISNSYGLLIILRLFISATLSMAYWTNLFELLAASERKHLIPIVIYFLTTVLSNICSSLAFFIPFYFYYAGIGLALLILNIINRLFVFQFIRSEFDFSVIDVALRGIRTSLAFFEIIFMSAIVHMNLAQFFTSVNLQKYKAIGKIDTSKHDLPTFWNFFDFNNDDKISFDCYYNSCTLGLALGFSLMTIFNVVQVKKQILSILTKIVFGFYILLIIRKDYIFGFKNSILYIIFYSSIAINFCIKLDDIIKGFKRFMELSEMSIDLSLIFLKSFNLCIIGFFIGLIIAFFTQIIIILIGHKTSEIAIAIGQAIYVILLFTWLFESSENDNFLIIKRIECEESSEEQTNIQIENNVQSNTNHQNNDNFNSNNQDKQKNDKFSRKSNRGTFSNENYNRSSYDNNKTNNEKTFFTNSDANSFSTAGLDFSQPSAPCMSILDNNDNHSTYNRSNDYSNNSRSNDYGNNRSNDYGNNRSNEYGNNNRSNQSNGNGRRRNQANGDRQRNNNYDNKSRFDNNSNNNQDNSTQQTASTTEPVKITQEAGDWE